jgi:hypothetical protein
VKRRGKAILAGVTAAASLGSGLLLIGGNAQAAENRTIRSTDFIQSLSATRDNGVVTVGDNGLGLATWKPATPVSPSPDKAAEYWTAGYRLSTVDAASMDVHGGPMKPGINLYVDLDNKNSTHMAGADGYKGADAILVGESVYGNDWWMPEGTATQAVKDVVNADPEMKTGGSGSTSHGTLAKWKSHFGTARVEAVGLSLGSGSGDTGVVVSKVVVGNHNYTFAGKPPATVVSPVSEAPQNVKVESTDTGTANLTWDAVPNAKGYRIYRSDLTNNIGASEDNKATIEGLKPNTTYKFTVAGYGADGSVGPKSDEAAGKTAKFALDAPKNLKCNATSSTAMRCTADAVPGANRYSWYTNVGSSPKIVAHGSSDAPYYDIVGLPAHSTRQVRVAADNDTQGPGPASSLITVKLK